MARSVPRIVVPRRPLEKLRLRVRRVTLLRLVWERQTRERRDDEVAEGILREIRSGRIRPSGTFRPGRGR